MTYTCSNPELGSPLCLRRRAAFGRGLPSSVPPSWPHFPSGPGRALLGLVAYARDEYDGKLRYELPNVRRFAC